MSQSFDLSGVTHVQLNGADCPKLMLNGVRIWERYTATRQVWVSSGYNQSVLTTMGTYNEYWSYSNDGRWGRSEMPAYAGGGTREPSHYSYSSLSFSYGGYTWYGYRGAHQRTYRSKKRKYTYYHQLILKRYVDSWVDTSAYQTESYTAYYY